MCDILWLLIITNQLHIDVPLRAALMLSLTSACPKLQRGVKPSLSLLLLLFAFYINSQILFFCSRLWQRMKMKIWKNCFNDRTNISKFGKGFIIGTSLSLMNPVEERITSFFISMFTNTCLLRGNIFWFHILSWFPDIRKENAVINVDFKITLK